MCLSGDGVESFYISLLFSGHYFLKVQIFLMGYFRSDNLGKMCNNKNKII